MELCHEHRHSIAYEGGSCPACDEIESLNDKIDTKDEEISDLESHVSKLEETIEELTK